jgi:hypothetical protein
MTTAVAALIRRLLTLVAAHVDSSPHLEFYLIWAQVSSCLHPVLC